MSKLRIVKRFLDATRAFAAFSVPMFRKIFRLGEATALRTSCDLFTKCMIFQILDDSLQTNFSGYDMFVMDASLEVQSVRVTANDRCCCSEDLLHPRIGCRASVNLLVGSISLPIVPATKLNGQNWFLFKASNITEISRDLNHDRKKWTIHFLNDHN